MVQRPFPKSPSHFSHIHQEKTLLSFVSSNQGDTAISEAFYQHYDEKERAHTWILGKSKVPVEKTIEELPKMLTSESLTEEYKRGSGKNIHKNLSHYAIQFLNTAQNLHLQGRTSVANLYIGVEDNQKITGISPNEDPIESFRKKLDNFLLGVFPPVPQETIFLDVIVVVIDHEPRWVLQLSVKLNSWKGFKFPFFSKDIGAFISKGETQPIALLHPLAVWWRERPQTLDHLIIASV